MNFYCVPKIMLNVIYDEYIIRKMSSVFFLALTFYFFTTIITF